MVSHILLSMPLILSYANADFVIVVLGIGDTDIVRRGFSPRIIEEPAILSQQDLLEILGLKSMPHMQDVTGEAASE